MGCDSKVGRSPLTGEKNAKKKIIMDFLNLTKEDKNLQGECVLCSEVFSHESMKLS